MVEDIFKASPDRYAAGMLYRRCGRSGVVIPRISLGMWHNFGGTVPFERSRAILRAAFDAGICHIDLANNYGPPYGSAEETFGRIMETDFKPYRDELFISTKAGYDMWPGPYGEWGSRKYLMASLDQSLRRMKLDYVDVFYSHRYDPNTPVEETMQALVDIVRSGKALYAAISNYPYEIAGKCYKYLEDRDVHCILHQCKYNIFTRDIEREGIIAQAGENGTGIIAFSPLNQGMLTARYLNGVPADSRAARRAFLTPEALTEDVMARVRALNGLAQERGQSLAQMALAWDLRDERVTSVIIGASSVEQLKDNLGALASPAFTAEELGIIDSLS